MQKDDVDLISLYRIVESVVNLRFHHPISFSLCVKVNELQQIVEQAMSIDENDERVALKIVWSLQNLQLFHDLTNDMLMRLHIHSVVMIVEIGQLIQSTGCNLIHLVMS